MTTAPALPALETLDTDTLSSLYNEAGRILLERHEGDLPAMVLEVIREALAEDGDTRKPLRAVFHTTEWDNGYFWAPSSARVTFFDGRTEEIETVDLSGADEVLTDHVSYLVDPLDSTDTLTIRFQPPTVRMS